MAHHPISFATIGSLLMLTLWPSGPTRADVPLYRVFETQLAHTGELANAFTDVSLSATFTAPSGRQIPFWGFYDGDGQGGAEGGVWKLRFMPDEAGRWSYTYSWSDGTPGGSGSFDCAAAGAGRGVLQPYAGNPRWFAYAGSEPVYLRSYYLVTGGMTGIPIEWLAAQVYDPLIARGYNHIMLNGLPLAYTDQVFSDAPAHNAARLYAGSAPSSTMDLGVWRVLEQHLAYLNDRDVGVHLFQGFDGKQEYASGSADWAAFSDEEREFVVRYACARLAPFANIAGWNFTWETEGDGLELAWADLIARHDPWSHLRTYHDERPAEHHYADDRYTFASVENHGYFGQTGGQPAHDTASHHAAALDAYAGKPVFMSEGNGLWRTCWGGTADTIRRAAWAVTTAGASFTYAQLSSEWASTDELLADEVDEQIELLHGVLQRELTFHRLAPHDELLASAATAYCLAEPGRQYLVFAESGAPFTLALRAGSYACVWIDTLTGERSDRGPLDLSADEERAFTPPNDTADWVLLLLAEESPADGGDGGDDGQAADAGDPGGEDGQASDGGEPGTEDGRADAGDAGESIAGSCACGSRDSGEATWALWLLVLVAARGRPR